MHGMVNISVLCKKSGCAMLLIVLCASFNTHAQTVAAPALTFAAMDGQKIRLYDLRGKIVLINFWATSCGICLKEMPDLIAAYRQYRSRGFEVIAVAMRYDEPEKIREYVRKQSVPFHVVFDRDGALAREFGQINGTPTTFLIDKSGRRISRTVGVINFKKLRAFLEAQS